MYDIKTECSAHKSKLQGNENRTRGGKLMEIGLLLFVKSKRGVLMELDQTYS